MGRRPERVHLFHLYRKDGTAVFLHPFRRLERLYVTLERGEIVGHYGREPRVETMTLFRNELYRLIEQEVRSWVADVRFIPRFLLASGAFLVSFLFFSLVVRDPLPVIDELVISGGLAVLAYILVGRRDLQSEAALKRRIAERTKVDAIVFNESEFVKRVEHALMAHDAERPEQLVEALIREEGDLAIEGHEEEAVQMVSYLDQLFGPSGLKRTEKRLRRLRSEKERAGRAHVGRWLAHRNVDVPLLTLYVQLKKKTRTGA